MTPPNLTKQSYDSLEVVVNAESQRATDVAADGAELLCFRSAHAEVVVQACFGAEADFRKTREAKFIAKRKVDAENLLVGSLFVHVIDKAKARIEVGILMFNQIIQYSSAQIRASRSSACTEVKADYELTGQVGRETILQRPSAEAVVAQSSIDSAAQALLESQTDFPGSVHRGRCAGK